MLHKQFVCGRMFHELSPDKFSQPDDSQNCFCTIEATRLRLQSTIIAGGIGSSRRTMRSTGKPDRFRMLRSVLRLYRPTHELAAALALTEMIHRLPVEHAKYPPPHLARQTWVEADRSVPLRARFDRETEEVVRESTSDVCGGASCVCGDDCESAIRRSHSSRPTCGWRFKRGIQSVSCSHIRCGTFQGRRFRQARWLQRGCYAFDFCMAQFDQFPPWIAILRDSRPGRICPENCGSCCSSAVTTA